MTRWRALLASVGLVAAVALFVPRTAEEQVAKNYGAGRYRDGRGRWGREGAARESGGSSLSLDLVAFYKFEGNGTDSAGLNPGTVNGTPTFSTGRVGLAISNGGNNANYVSRSIVLGSAFTMSAWVKTPSDTSTAYIVEPTGYTGWGLDASGARYARFRNPWNVPYNSTAVVPLNTWVHVVSTYDGTTMRWYVDGAAAGTNAIASFSQTVVNYGGGDPLFGAFPGQVDELAFWTRAITAAEAAQLYAANGSPL